MTVSAHHLGIRALASLPAFDPPSEVSPLLVEIIDAKSVRPAPPTFAIPGIMVPSNRVHSMTNRPGCGTFNEKVIQ